MFLNIENHLLFEDKAGWVKMTKRDSRKNFSQRPLIYALRIADNVQPNDCSSAQIDDILTEKPVRLPADLRE